jgi:uncharacterized membrane protein YbhN (UPF0104 family)
MRSIITTTLKLILTGVIIYFVGRQLVQNWPQVSSYDWQVNPPILVLSIIVQLAAFFLYSKVWCIIIEGFGYSVSLPHGFKISYMTNMGRYLPGRVWQVFGMLYLCKKISIPQTVAVASWGITLLFSMIASVIAGAIAVALNPEIISGELAQYTGPSLYVTAATILILSFYFVLQPNRTLGLYNWLLTKLNRKPIEARITVAMAAQIYIGSLLCWIGYGIAFWLFVQSVAKPIDMPLLWGVAAYIVPYQLGYLAFFTPGGIGVRELAMTALLAPYFGPISAGIAIAARIWNLTIESAAAIVGWLIPMENK